MADPTKGTEHFENMENESNWFLQEAECIDSLNTLDDLFENSTDGSCISNLIDDAVVEQGNSLALYNQQSTVECDRAIKNLKRKYTKTAEQSSSQLSLQLNVVSKSPRQQAKRRLFGDSGIEDDEAENILTQVDNNSNSSQQSQNGGECSQLSVQSNTRVINMAKFKRHFGISFSEITRPFRSNKSCSENWVVSVHSAAEEVLESSKLILPQHCDFLQVIIQSFSGLFLVLFKSAKSRDTVINLFCSILNVHECQLICDPPKIRNVAAALYFYKKSLNKNNFMLGEFPEWLAKQVLVEHQQAAETFELAEMVQWAYDNDFTEEQEIAYKYAELALENSNAAAFLKSNNHLKFVKDCSALVKMYKRHEMRTMTMSNWIWKCCKTCKEDGDWKNIAHFLKYQQVNMLAFLGTLREFFKSIPKKQCIVFWGPPNTGKSYFVFSLLQFLKGRVVSIMNRQSQFWLQPLIDTRLGLLDDVTYPAWQYIDINLRSGLDGNHVSIDAKHRAPLHFKLPPLLATTNIDVEKESSLMYLQSRLKCFHFPNAMPFDSDNNPAYPITDITWKCFFRKLYKQLDLSAPEEEGDGNVAERPFSCTARGSHGEL